jgi:hypothetical protein
MFVPVDRRHHSIKEKSNRDNGNTYNHHAWGNTYCRIARCASGGTARQTSKSEEEYWTRRYLNRDSRCGLRTDGKSFNGNKPWTYRVEETGHSAASAGWND